MPKDNSNLPLNWRDIPGGKQLPEPLTSFVAVLSKHCSHRRTIRRKYIAAKNAHPEEATANLSYQLLYLQHQQHQLHNEVSSWMRGVLQPGALIYVRFIRLQVLCAWVPLRVVQQLAALPDAGDMELRRLCACETACAHQAGEPLCACVTSSLQPKQAMSSTTECLCTKFNSLLFSGHGR